jgi:hypothetical protein
VVVLDDAPAGQPERLDALKLRQGPLYLRVEERPFFDEPNPSRASREKAFVPYTLRVEPLGPGLYEEEPNDTLNTANEAPLTRPLSAFTGVPVEFPDEGKFERSAPQTSPDYFKVTVEDEKATVAVLVVPPAGGHLGLVEGATLNAWAQKRAAGGGPERIKVHAVEAPKVLELKPIGATRLVRVHALKGTTAGTLYQLAFATSEPNGLSGVITLAQQLQQAGTPLTREVYVELAKAFSRSPQLPEVLALVKP